MGEWIAFNLSPFPKSRDTVVRLVTQPQTLLQGLISCPALGLLLGLPSAVSSPSCWDYLSCSELLGPKSCFPQGSLHPVADSGYKGSAM